MPTSHPVMSLARRLQSQIEDLPDICSGFEMIIDEIPDGKDACECGGSTIDCVFHGVCPEGKFDSAHCADTILYQVAFEAKDITVLSCAKLQEGNFKETCAKVSLAPDLQLGECIVGRYGGQECSCDVCADQNSLRLDCSMYDPRAVADCTAMGLSDISPMVHGFNVTAPAPEIGDQGQLYGQVDPTTLEGDNVSGAIQTATTVVSLASVLVVSFVALL